MKHRVRRVSVHQTARTFALVYGAFGILYIGFGFLLDSVSPPGEKLGLVWLVAPVFFLVLGYLSIAVASLVYNQIARITGGIAFTLEPDVVDGEHRLTSDTGRTVDPGAPAV